jgi:hypothetical protein
MSLPMIIFDAPPHDLRAMLYFAQSAVYGVALLSNCRGRHAPWMVYVASCLIYLGLGLTHRGLSGCR